jgi:hypothetical protein
MARKYTGMILFLCLLIPAVYSQENQPPLFAHRATIGNYNSFGEDDIGIIEAGYDFTVWFHTSNNDVYGKDGNPSLNAVGIAAGIQL